MLAAAQGGKGGTAVLVEEQPGETGTAGEDLQSPAGAVSANRHARERSLRGKFLPDSERAEVGTAVPFVGAKQLEQLFCVAVDSAWMIISCLGLGVIFLNEFMKSFTIIYCFYEVGYV